MPEPILFLDFDGVLHPNICPRSAWFSRMGLLEEALADAEVRIVISSSWRFHHAYAALTRNFPVSLRMLLAGTTGDAHIGAHARFHEINAWLQRYAPALGEAGWRALDDAGFEFPPDCASLIHCDGAIGITATDVAAIRSWLPAYPAR